MNQFQYINRGCLLPYESGASTIDLTGANLNLTPSTSQTELWYQDDNGPFLKRFINDGAGGITVANLDISGNAYTPVGTQSPLQSDTNFKQICTRCLVDDVNGDGSVLTKYVEAYYQSVDANGLLTVTTLGTFTDDCLNTAYTVQGTSVNPDTIGTAAAYKSQRRIFENVFTWSPPLTAHSYTVAVYNPGAGVTFTDSDGITTPLGELAPAIITPETFAHENLLSDNAPIITGTAGSRVLINYTELG